jgi:hypothetical protein
MIGGPIGDSVETAPIQRLGLSAQSLSVTAGRKCAAWCSRGAPFVFNSVGPRTWSTNNHMEAR